MSTFNHYREAFHHAIATAKQTGKVQEITQWGPFADGSEGFDVTPVFEARRGASIIWAFPDGVAHHNFFAYNPEFKARSQ